VKDGGCGGWTSLIQLAATSDVHQASYERAEHLYLPRFAG